MGRISLKDTRQKEIILAFYTVAKKIGLENASIAKVADHMDINPSLIVHYFKTREALFSGLIAFILEQYSGIYKTNGQDYANAGELKQLINNLFSRKWNKLFDDSVFYSCYALVYRDKKIRTAFKALHDSLRKLLTDALQKANKNGAINIRNEKETVEIIFALMEGAYYYLGMIDSKTDYTRKLNMLKRHALLQLGL
jgi:AcrR family transcriptional regulator